MNKKSRHFLRTKSLLCLLMAAIMLLGSMGVKPLETRAEESDTEGSASGVEINETNFPDDEFRGVVEGFDTDEDGYLSEEEIEAVKSINLWTQGGNYTGGSIKDLTGIEYFTSLTSLDCSFNELTTLDVSKNVNLGLLYCFNNQLTSLDISGNTNLMNLSCDNNPLTELDVSNCPLTGVSLEGTDILRVEVGETLDVFEAIGMKYYDVVEWWPDDYEDYATISGSKVTGVSAGDFFLLMTYTNDYANDCGCGMTIHVVESTDDSTDDSSDDDYMSRVAKAVDETGMAFLGTALGDVYDQYSKMLVLNEDGEFVMGAGSNADIRVWFDKAYVADGDNYGEYKFRDDVSFSWTCDDADGVISHWNQEEDFLCKQVDEEGNVTGYYLPINIGGGTVGKGALKFQLTDGDTVKTLNVDVRVLFNDVDNDIYYADPVYWALEKGITTGKHGGQTFAPSDTCTRAQIVTFLWRLAGKPDPGEIDQEFTDVTDKSAYYYKAIYWAKNNGITSGRSGGKVFDPNGTCTRREIVTFLWRYAGKPTPSETGKFSDVQDSSAYYYKAVYWAVEQGVTTGKRGGKTFDPTGLCTRGMAVTFLYRYAN